MSDEARFSTWREEARAYVMVVTLGREYEGRVRVVELTRDGEHLRFGETVRVQHDACRVAGKALAGERFDLMDLNLTHGCNSKSYRATDGGPGMQRAILELPPRKRNTMDIGVEISLYPFQADFASVIHQFIDRLNGDGRFRVVS